MEKVDIYGEIKIKISDDDLKRYKADIERRKERIETLLKTVSLNELMTSRKGGEILKIIEGNNQALEECLDGVLDYILNDEYKQNHLWALIFFQHLLEKFGSSTFRMLQPSKLEEVLIQMQSNQDRIKKIKSLLDDYKTTCVQVKTELIISAEEAKQLRENSTKGGKKVAKILSSQQLDELLDLRRGEDIKRLIDRDADILIFCVEGVMNYFLRNLNQSNDVWALMFLHHLFEHYGASVVQVVEPARMRKVLEEGERIDEETTKSIKKLTSHYKQTNISPIKTTLKTIAFKKSPNSISEDKKQRENNYNTNKKVKSCSATYKNTMGDHRRYEIKSP